MAQAVFRVPWIAIVVGLYHKAYTSPNPPTKHERKFNNWVDKTLFRSIAFVTMGQKSMMYLVGGAQAAVAAAVTYPSMPYATESLQFLVLKGGSAQRIAEGTGGLGFWIGTGLIVAGSLLRWACYRALGKHFTFEVASSDDHQLVTSGPYSIVRHPSYLGVLLCTAGVWIWQGTPGSWLRESGVLKTAAGCVGTGICIAWMTVLAYGGVLRAVNEDNILQQKFGQQWEDWRRQVPYLLIPFVY